MAYTQEEINRILGKQSVVQRAFNENRPTVTNTPKSIVSGTYADLLQPATNNIVGDILLGDIQRGLNSASYSQPLTTGGSVQTGGFRPEYLALALGLTPAGKGAKIAKKTEYEIAHELAQKNAALPVSKGGLGLPVNNTAMERANAMGFYTPSFRSVDDPTITYFKPSEMGTYGGGVYSAKSPEIAEGYGNQFLMPLLINKGKDKSFNSFSDYVSQKTNNKLTNQYKDDLQNQGYNSLNVKFFKDGDIREYNNFNPSDVRSRFATFDPFRRNEADILAGVGVGIPTAGLLDEKKKK